MTGSLRAYARHRAEAGLDGGTLAGVQKALSSGRIAKEADGGIDFEKADASWSSKTAPSVNSRTARHRNTHPPTKPPVSAARPDQPSKAQSQPATVYARSSAPADGDNFAKARAMKEGFLAGLAQLEYKRKTGELVPIAEVEQKWGSIIAAIRNRLLLAPARLAPKVAALTDPRQCEAVVAAEIKAALSELSGVHEKAA